MGKGGGALSAWIKEFVTLVFTQTIQAFIFAIIISIILFGMVESDYNLSGDDNNAALGLMATFALLSVFKVEEMAKKIFGVGDTKASHKNAMKSIAKTAIAAKLGGKVLNNAGKFLGGIGAINKAGKDRRKLKKRLDEDMKDNGYELKNGELVPRSGGSAGAVGDSDVDAASTSAGGAGTKGSKSGSASGSAQMSNASYRRVKNALRAYEEKADEIDKAKREGYKAMISSVAESTGAVFGGTAGAILYGADGDIEEMLQGMASGAGVGDIAGKNTVEAIDRATQFVARNVKHESGLSSKELKRAITNYKDALDKANVGRPGSVNMDDLDI